MTETAETPIDAALLGTVRTTGTVTPLTGERIAVENDDRLHIHDARTFLTGATAPLRTLPLPPHSAATAHDNGAIIAEAARIRRIADDGTTLWELPHAPWHGSPYDPRPPGPPAVHPSGALISALVPTLTTGDQTTVHRHPGPPRLDYTCDTLLLLDAATGRIEAQRPISGIASVATQRWHPDGSLLALSRWTAWYSWSSYWIEPRHDGLHIRGGTTMREVIDFLPTGTTPGTPRVLTFRRAEHIAANDDRNELASHEVTADEPTALRDLTELTDDPAADEFDGAFLLDDRHLLVTGRIYPPGRPAVTRHWLCDARTLQPLGRIRYPHPAGWVTPLGDGTWLTRSPDALHHWSLP
ncbi:hypothetical protein ABT391_15765 [Streptomyces jumonjinensis]|uniref:hypothetical protein n=1 Tax=Streptomyces jumonjinensis TaxID=1945 RepID=UPI00332333CB